VLAGERDLLIVVALPGVESQDIEISSEPGGLRGVGVRRQLVPHPVPLQNSSKN
jgi:HSP20 family molecular chaperone IbpA